MISQFSRFHIHERVHNLRQFLIGFVSISILLYGGLLSAAPGDIDIPELSLLNTSDNSAEVEWALVADADGYDVLLDGELLTDDYPTTSERSRGRMSHIIQGLESDNCYQITILAWDWDENFSPRATTEACLGNIPDEDNTPPAKPRNLKTTSIETNSISIKWGSFDADAVSFKVYWDAQTLDTTSQSAVISELQPATSYQISVTALDRAGNESAASAITVDTLPIDDDDNPPGQGLRIIGKQLVDNCGKPVVIRGVEQPLGIGIDVDESWTKLIDEIARSGANAVRPLFNAEQMDRADMKIVLDRIRHHNMITFLSPMYADNRHNWFVKYKSLFQQYDNIIIDVYAEPAFDDRDRWVNDVTTAITNLRAQGYTNVFMSLANDYGRDVKSLFERGQEILNADSLGQSMLGWQAYWGNSNIIQDWWDLSLHEAIELVAESPLPIQIGIDYIADPEDPMDYALAMRDAQQHGLGWLWWDWYNPFDWMDNQLSNDGTFDNLNTNFGGYVVTESSDSIKSTSKEVCF